MVVSVRRKYFRATNPGMEARAKPGAQSQTAGKWQEPGLTVIMP